ncbi:helix-turn-helix, type 11 domain-containing protein [Pseudopedobacter saltans DSM 12145]|uniref:Helix-turn-helix, type 11 domain-containing protein n=1 Tax=Pseudopedobacter saltans (strain ATCC 51119 / DSM 12145 / JCM 21818 / CCUG 39354 / LMG 10337 / NBRC 100064 / NCIMB 13643) TaxID=762903 RepID=F0S9Y7_PSESL|nr:YafY family protein [Pseudopedobacter saltans]ADY52545.1 helix-turn-helix, type 11 domain-containing protein [Pseudopedobacter saltans DSM 12145]
MDDLSLKKFDRVVSILTSLQSKRTVKAQELADKFNVSLRTIYRDIKTLEASGVPLIGEAGIGYSIVEGYRLPPIMFTKQEASSFVTAEKLMASFADKNIRESFQSGVEKVKSVLKSADKDWLQAIDNQIAIYHQKKLFNETLPHVLETVLESIASKKQINLFYKSFNEEYTKRIIEPVGVFNEYSYWYILGYCTLREDYRKFRTDRIEGLTLTDIAFTKEHGSIEELRKRDSSENKRLIRILVDKSVTKYLTGTKKYYGFIKEQTKDNLVEMDFMAEEQYDEYFVRWLLMFADYATIIEPVSLKDKIREMLNRIVARL